MIEDLHDRRVARSATGLLRELNLAEVLEASDIQVATRLGAMAGETSEMILVAVALTVRAARLGSVCLDLSDPGVEDVPLVDPADVVDSPLIEQQLLRLDGSLLYLDRYWREERQVCADLLARLSRPALPVDPDLLEQSLDRVLGAVGFEEQRAIVAAAATRTTTVLTGGPGTGKTTTVAGLLEVLSEEHERATGRVPRIALCAPTAKAAARLSEAVGRDASTLHRLLGALPGLVRTRFRHDRDNQLPHDVVVVDETSMVSLTHMARLLEAVRPDARLVLVGDADQLASIEAGAVLADVVAGLRDHPGAPVAELTTVHRFGGAIAELADALRVGDADRALDVLGSGDPSVQLIDPDDTRAVDAVIADVVERARSMSIAAESGDAVGALAALDQHRLLCAHREGPYGVRSWNARVERGLADATGVTHYTQWFVGRPVLVTANNQTLGIWNGDVGVTLRRPDGRLEVALAAAGEPRRLATTRLPDTETLYSTTVHKAQGSQARVVTVVLPDAESSLLTRELFYTAVTRAQEQVRIIGDPESLRAAVERRALRASGLADRLMAGTRGEL